MVLENIALLLAFISTCGMGLILYKYIMFKRELFKLKEEMKSYHLEHGFDNHLWELFIERTRKMFKY